MLTETLVEKLPVWAAEDGPDCAMALMTQATLSRNLADFHFSQRCTEEEKAAIEHRIVSTLDTLSLLSMGQYFSFPDLDVREMRFLAERRLATQDLIAARGPRGVYVSEDQAMSIMVNAQEHLVVRVVLPGLQPQEAWARLNLIDDTLNGVLDFAYEDRLGYLTSVLAHVGTGLKASVVLHLPGLALSGHLGEQLALAEQHRLLFYGLRAGTDLKFPRMRATRDESGDALLPALKDDALYTDIAGGLPSHLNEAEGDLFLLVNQSTLGYSEEEIFFQIRHVATEILRAEQSARESLAAGIPRGLEDRAGRALGLATGARLLGFREGLSLLSSLRLGVGAGLLRDLSHAQTSEVLLASQGAHLELGAGHCETETQLNFERANLFRHRFAGVDRKF